MLEKRNEREKAINRVLKDSASSPSGDYEAREQGRTVISDTEMFSKIGIGSA